MDESSQAAVMPSESLHDILKCELGEENEKLLESARCTTFDNQLDDEEARQCELEHYQHSQGVEEVSRERERQRKSAWSQTCSKHHQSVKIDLSLKRSGQPEPPSTSTTSSRKLTLVRGSSLSLVDLPTFLPSSVRLGKLASISHLIQNIPIHKQLQQRREGRAGLPMSDKTMGKKSQWTVMCVALGFFSSCLILVGCMLSITSEYQDQAIARMLNMSLEDIQTKG